MNFSFAKVLQSIWSAGPGFLGMIGQQRFQSPWFSIANRRYAGSADWYFHRQHRRFAEPVIAGAMCFIPFLPPSL